jgi:hypothetical protein
MVFVPEVETVDEPDFFPVRLKPELAMVTV